MKTPRPIAIVAAISASAASLLLAESAMAQISLLPPGIKPPHETPVARPRAEPHRIVKRPAVHAAEKSHAVNKTPPPPPAAPAAAATPEPNDPNVDLVYGAYQRGHFKTAFDLAMVRAKAGDPKAMTMLGVLYSAGYGIPLDDAEAVKWYQRASDAGDREAMFQLAMMRMAGRGGPVDKQAAVKLLASAAKLGESKAAYNLALLYIAGDTLPHDVKRAAELLRQAADAGLPQAEYGLAIFYRDGTGVPKNLEKSVQLLQKAAIAGNVEAEVEYAIALYNGTGTLKNRPAAVDLLRKAARQGNPIAQNRLAHVLVTGQGAPMDKIEGLKWHLIARARGRGDLFLDEALAQLSPADRAKVEAEAKQWLGVKDLP